MNAFGAILAPTLPIGETGRLPALFGIGGRDWMKTRNPIGRSRTRSVRLNTRRGDNLAPALRLLPYEERGFIRRAADREC